jgi:hypothetical protein
MVTLLQVMLLGSPIAGPFGFPVENHAITSGGSSISRGVASGQASKIAAQRPISDGLSPTGFQSTRRATRSAVRGSDICGWSDWAAGGGFGSWSMCDIGVTFSQALCAISLARSEKPP